MSAKIPAADRAKFIEVLALEVTKPIDPETLADIGRLILRSAATHGRYAVEECNRELSASEVSLHNASCERLARYANRLGVTLTLGGDPRGYTVKLMTPKSGKYNTWGGAEDGWGVPTS